MDRSPDFFLDTHQSSSYISILRTIEFGQFAFDEGVKMRLDALCISVLALIDSRAFAPGSSSHSPGTEFRVHSISEV
jgi:hypothetical protein